MGVLLNFDRHDPLRSIGKKLGEDLRYFEGEAKERLGLSALFVRPDGVVAWACDGKPDVGEVIAALSQWIP
jgi:hypothetical protein